MDAVNNVNNSKFIDRAYFLLFVSKSYLMQSMILLPPKHPGTTPILVSANLLLLFSKLDALF